MNYSVQIIGLVTLAILGCSSKPPEPQAAKKVSNKPAKPKVIEGSIVLKLLVYSDDDLAPVAVKLAYPKFRRDFDRPKRRLIRSWAYRDVPLEKVPGKAYELTPAFGKAFDQAYRQIAATIEEEHDEFVTNKLLEIHTDGGVNRHWREELEEHVHQAGFLRVRYLRYWEKHFPPAKVKVEAPNHEKKRE